MTLGHLHDPGQPQSQEGTIPTGQGGIKDNNRTWPLLSDLIMPGFPCQWSKPKRGLSIHINPACCLLIRWTSRWGRQQTRKTRVKEERPSSVPQPWARWLPPATGPCPWNMHTWSAETTLTHFLFPLGPGQCPTKYCDKFETAGLLGKCTLPLKYGRNRGF